MLCYPFCKNRPVNRSFFLPCLPADPPVRRPPLRHHLPKVLFRILSLPYLCHNFQADTFRRKMIGGQQMPQDVIEKVRAALAARNLMLISNLARIVMILPERGRVNVMVRGADGREDAATLTLDENGNLSVQLSDEGRNVRLLTRRKK